MLWFICLCLIIVGLEYVNIERVNAFHIVGLVFLLISVLCYYLVPEKNALFFVFGLLAFIQFLSGLVLNDRPRRG